MRFCDDVILGRRSIISSLIELFNLYQAPIVLLERVPKKLVSRFGVVEVSQISNLKSKISNLKSKISNFKSKIYEGKIYEIKRIVEKPLPKDAPSNLTIVGGYVLTPHIIGNLKSIAETLPVIANDALPLAVALEVELIMGGKVYGWEFEERRLDCGTLEALRKTEKALAVARTLSSIGGSCLSCGSFCLFLPPPEDASF